MADAPNKESHLLLYVPNYDGSNTDAAGAPRSYIRLGSLKPHEDLATERARGDDLMSAVGLSQESHSAFFVDDRRGSSCVDQSALETAFVNGLHTDELHDAGDCLDAVCVSADSEVYSSRAGGSYDPTKTRPELTDELLGTTGATPPRGGLREHTDGNRIVTVRGDRVDLIVGNYKRVVVGRVSGAEVGPTGWESGGGHSFAQSSDTSLSTYAIEHVESFGGTAWKVVERSTKGNLILRFEGNSEEVHNGPSRIVRTGTGVEGASSNPVISRSTRYENINRTASGASFERSVHADEIEDATTGSSRNASMFALDVVRQRGSCSKAKATFSESVKAKTIYDFQVFLARANVEAGGIRTDEEIAAYRLVSGVTVTGHVGPVVRFQYGSRTRCVIGTWQRFALSTSVSVDVGLYTEVSAVMILKKAVYGAYRIGNLQISYTKAQNKILEERALGLLMEL